MGGRCALPLTSHYITMHDRDTPCTCRHSYYALRFLDIRKYRVIMANNQAESTKNFASYTIPEGLDVQCNAHCRLCTVGLRRTKQFREIAQASLESYCVATSSDSEWHFSEWYWYQNQVIAPSPLRECRGHA